MQRPHLGLHLARTLGGWAGLALMFASVAYIPLADATAISFINPVFGMIFAIPFLGERVGKWRWLAAGISLIGAMILLRPTKNLRNVTSIVICSVLTNASIKCASNILNYILSCRLIFKFDSNAERGNH